MSVTITVNVYDDPESAPVRSTTFTELPCRLPGNRGFDTVWVKKGRDGVVTQLTIVESKFSSVGRASLRMTKTMGRQMSDEWIDKNIIKMLKGSDLATKKTGLLLHKYRSLITKKANVLSPSGINRWGRVKIP